MDYDLSSSLRARRPQVIKELRRPLAGRIFRRGEIAVVGEVLVTPPQVLPAREWLAA